MSWIDIGAIEDIPLRGARLVKTPVGCVALFRTGENEVFAASDRCPHKGGPLSEGIVYGRAVTCPLHNWVFDLETGRAQGADEGSIPTYPLRIEDGRLLIDGEAVGRRAAA
ncbi:nitrite reductase small subunit NirD [Limimaricola cinnabarinus]|uniref:Nitrite reductase (NAD(P)H) small subunit n=1 Tax=Limimaricola cinnabarinus TaxID=1125964 RepID=A0A2G1MEC5_9RHOB|nr:nitrite reductase small subunit NirD [Limimaricola cinnabarinus]PHP27095.1 nitrite reductase (NAD(P)H) small subunit [Limimaricola cinnabarinus]